MSTMAGKKDEAFAPQPGDIILLRKPVQYSDGTHGPLVKLYKDNFFFAESSKQMMSTPPTHKFKRAEKIVRLFKLYKNWEFVSRKTHNLYLYYEGLRYFPGIDTNEPWHLIKKIRNQDHVKKNLKLPSVSNFTHLSPSRLFTTLTKDVFSPRHRDLIIRTLPRPEVKTPGEKCARCKQQEEDALYWRYDANDPVSLPPERDVDSTLEGCDYCNCIVNRNSKTPIKMPWANRWDLEYWTEAFEPQVGDLLVRSEIDIQYDGQFKKTHFQVEMFAYIPPEKKWKYMGMDVADFGPLVQIHDIVYRPQPGDIIISKGLKWTTEYDPSGHVGGSAMFYRDETYYDDEQNWWQTSTEKEIKSGKFNLPTGIPRDSWIVRIGAFDEYWDFHLKDRADVFAMHSNQLTMLLHYSSDFPYSGQKAVWKSRADDDPEPPLMDEAKVEPNQWDMVIRPISKVYEDPLKTRDWQPDPHHWMKDPALWGRDIPPRFDKEVELHIYWSGFVFEDNDMLLRAGYSLMNEEEAIHDFDANFFSPELWTEFGPPNAPIPFLRYVGSVELYLVRVDDSGENPPKFLFLGRDQYVFPDEDKDPGKILYADEEKKATPPEKQKNKAKQGEGDQRPKANVIIVRADPNDRINEAAKKKAEEERKREASRTLKLSGGIEIALD